MSYLKSVVIAGTLACVASFATAGESWTIDTSASSISFGSIKNDTVGESHNFSGVSGSIDAEGNVALEIDLTSVETNIEIRNERMTEFVFKNAPKAKIVAEVDMEEVNSLEVGESAVTDAFGTLNLLGNEVDVDAALFVMRLTEDKVMVTTDGMAMLNVSDAGINAGIDKLQEIAGLDSITRVSPVTMRLIFSSKGDSQS
ncbi:MAG: YceI family protein [Pseudomonadota bacterium]